LLELAAVMRVYTMNAAILRVMDHQAAADARQLTPREGRCRHAKTCCAQLG
jgi:hypothetical protein